MTNIQNKWLYAIIAFSINLWNFAYLDLKIYQLVHLVIFIFILFYTYKSYKTNIINQNNILVLLMCALPIFSIISCKILHNQSIVTSIIVWRMHIGWLIYYVLWYKNIKIKDIYKVILFISIIYTAITLLQQFTYPIAPFGARTFGSGYDEKFNGEVESRMGFYRFVVGGVYYTGISLLLYWGKHKKHIKSTKGLLISLLFILAIIANGYRNIIIAIIFSLIYCKWGIKKTLKYFILFFPISVILFSSIFTGLLTTASEDIENSRAVSYVYFFNEYSNNWFSILFGNGVSHDSSQYGEYFEELFANKIICSDTGLLGATYYWGGIYIVVYLFLLTKLLVNKYLDRCYKSVFIFILIPSWTMLPMWEIQGCILHGIIIYLAHRNIYDNLKINSNDMQ